MNNPQKLHDDEIPVGLRAKFADPQWGAERLSAIGVFKCFSIPELTKIYIKGRIRVLRPAAHAVVEGENSRGVFLILSGSMSVYKTDHSSGGMFRIAYLSEGQSFGEMSLFDRAPRSATVAADVSSYLFHLDAKDFESFLSAAGDDVRARFYKACAEDLSGRFRVLNADYLNSQQLLWKYALRRSEGGPRSA